MAITAKSARTLFYVQVTLVVLSTAGIAILPRIIEGYFWPILLVPIGLIGPQAIISHRLGWKARED